MDISEMEHVNCTARTPLAAPKDLLLFR